MRRSAAAGLGAFAAILLLPSTAGAGGCNLIATSGGGSPASVEVGDVVSIEGFGFALGDVELVFAVDGAEVRTEIVTAADDFGNVGYFILDVTVDEVGDWEIVATEVDGSCSASEGFPVAAAPVPSPTASGLPNVATAPPGTPLSPAWVLGVAFLLLSGLTVLHRARSKIRR